MAALLHPNLALIFGAESWRGTPMLVCEYLEGGTLSGKLKERNLVPGETVELGIALAGALEETHRVGILHRDIKPSNIGYSREGTPKLLDFGLARILAGELESSTIDLTALNTGNPLVTSDLRSLTVSGGVVGTPAYLSPEAAQQKPPDPSFDLWSLAIVLFETLTGENPLLGATLRETLDRILAASIPDVREKAPDCPQPLASFLKDALSAELKSRPANARQFKARLSAIRATLPSD